MLGFKTALWLCTMFVYTTCLLNEPTGRSSRVEEVNEKELKYKPLVMVIVHKFVCPDDNVICLLIKLRLVWLTMLTKVNINRLD